MATEGLIPTLFKSACDFISLANMQHEKKRERMRLFGSKHGINEVLTENEKEKKTSC